MLMFVVRQIVVSLNVSTGETRKMSIMILPSKDKENVGLAMQLLLFLPLKPELELNRICRILLTCQLKTQLHVRTTIKDVMEDIQF